MARADTINAPRGGKRIAARARAAIGYVRRSTDRQEQSIPDQKKAIEKYIDDHDLRLLRFYVDDAISGTSTVGRRAFQDMIADAKRRSCDFRFVVVYDVKRFGRVDNDEAGYYRYILRTEGVEIIYVSENFTGDGTDDLLRPVKQWQAREESKDLAKVVIRGQLSKTESGGGGWWMGGAPPYGYDLAYESQTGECLFYLRYMPDGSKQMFDEKWKLIRTLQRGESVAVSRRDRCKLVPSEESRVETIKRIFAMSVRRLASVQHLQDGAEALEPPANRVDHRLRYTDQFAGVHRRIDAETGVIVDSVLVPLLLSDHIEIPTEVFHRRRRDAIVVQIELPRFFTRFILSYLAPPLPPPERAGEDVQFGQAAKQARQFVEIIQHRQQQRRIDTVRCAGLGASLGRSCLGALCLDILSRGYALLVVVPSRSRGVALDSFLADVCGYALQSAHSCGKLVQLTSSHAKGAVVTALDIGGIEQAKETAVSIPRCLAKETEERRGQVGYSPFKSPEIVRS